MEIKNFALGMVWLEEKATSAGSSVIVRLTCGTRLHGGFCGDPCMFRHHYMRRCQVFPQPPGISWLSLGEVVHTSHSRCHHCQFQIENQIFPLPDSYPFLASQPGMVRMKHHFPCAVTRCLGSEDRRQNKWVGLITGVLRCPGKGHTM